MYTFAWVSLHFKLSILLAGLSHLYDPVDEVKNIYSYIIKALTVAACCS